jgi:hypothetical protein
VIALQGEFEMRELLFPAMVIALLLSPLGVAAWLRRPSV